MSATATLRAEIVSALRAAANPDKAEPMQAYMRSEMPFFGVTKPERTRALKPVLSNLQFDDAATFRTTVCQLWDEAKHREERYAVLDLAKHRRQRTHRQALGLDALGLWQHFIVSGAWWDWVDDIAIHLVREIFDAHARRLSETMRSWSVDENLWMRRTAIICQVGRKTETDWDLLTNSADANLNDKEFFIRKAIGWALRDYARSNPDAVREYLRTRWDRLSGLSRREASKHLSM